MDKINSPNELNAIRQAIIAQRDPDKTCITICTGTGCLAYGTQKMVDSFRAEIDKRNLTGTVDLRTSGCHGFCERGPIVVIYPERIFYQRVGLDDAPEILDKTIEEGEIIERLLYVDPVSDKRIVHENEVPFYQKQERLLLNQNPEIDPRSLEDYLALGGYSALAKVLSSMKSQQVIDEIIASKLRGRGGGGFPCGWKWSFVRAIRR